MSETPAIPITGAEKINWDLSDLYTSSEDPNLAKDKEEILNEADAFAAKYKGKIAELSVSEFKAMLMEYEALQDKGGKIGSFAYLQWSTNTTNSGYGKLVQEANELGSELNQKLVFLDVEWMQVSDEDAQKMIDAPELDFYKHYLESSRRYKNHVLKEEQEQILSAKSVTGRSAWIRFFDETLGQAKFELDGKEYAEQEVLSKLHDGNRDLRIRAHASLTKKFKELAHPLTYVFNTLLADKSTNDKLREYPSWITSRNMANETDDATVDALVNAVTSNYPMVQRYYNLKAKLLGLDNMYDYDRYAPMMQNEATITWEEARKMVMDSYTEFHPNMGEITAEFLIKTGLMLQSNLGKEEGPILRVRFLPYTRMFL